jgi:hypothetical protein
MTQKEGIKLPAGERTFTVSEYAEALLKLPEGYLRQDYSKVFRHVVLQGRIVVCGSGEGPLIYQEGVWKKVPAKPGREEEHYALKQEYEHD